MEYIIHISIIVCIYIIIVLPTNLLCYAGKMISLAQAAFYGLGAYLSVLCLMVFKLDVISTLIVVSIINGGISLIISLPVLKLREDYFILATLSFQFIIHGLLMNIEEITGGTAGIAGIPTGTILHMFTFSSGIQYLVLSLILAFIVITLIYKLRSSVFHSLLRALSENETLLRVRSRKPLLIKASTFLLSSILISWAAVIYTIYMGYIHPNSFGLEESIFILTAALLSAGFKVPIQVIVIAIFVLVPELIRFIGIPGPTAAALKQIIFGMFLLLFVLFNPFTTHKKQYDSQ